MWLELFTCTLLHTSGTHGISISIRERCSYINIYESVVKSESRQFMWWQACWESRPEAGARNGCIFTFQLSTVNFSTYTLLTFLQRGLSAEGGSGKRNPGIGQ